MAYDPYAALGVERPTATAAPVASVKAGYDPYAELGVKPPEVGGLRASAMQVVGSTLKGVGQLGSDFIPGVSSDNALGQKGQEIIDANPTAVQGFRDIVDKPGTFVKEAVGNALPSVGGMLGLRALGAGITAAAPLAGPAAPLVAGAGQLVSWAGPTVVAALPSYSGIRDAQGDNSLTSKLLGAGGSLLVGRIEQMGGGEALAGKLISKEGRDQLTKGAGKMALAKTIGKEAGKSAIGEGVEEGLQNPIEQLAGYQNPLTAENLQETAFGMAAGAVGGGVIGGAMGPFVHVAAKDAPPPDPKIEDVQRQTLAKATGGEVELNNGLATITQGENTVTAPVEALVNHFAAGKTLDTFDTAAATEAKLNELKAAVQDENNPLSFNDLVALRDDPAALKQVGVNRQDIANLVEAEIERGVDPEAAWIKQERLAQQANQAAFERLQGQDNRVQAAQANTALNQTMGEQVADYWERLMQVPGQQTASPADTSPAVGSPPSPTETLSAGDVAPEQQAAVSRLTELEQKAQGLPGVSTPASLTMQEEQEYQALRSQASPADAQALMQYQANVARRDALLLKQQGAPAFETVGEDGQATVVPAAPSQTLTPKEQTELTRLTEATKQPPVSPYTDDSRPLAAGLPAAQSETLFSQGGQGRRQAQVSEGASEPLNASALTSTLDQEFGKGTVSRLTRQGKVQIVAAASEVPGVGPLSANQQRKAQGVYRSKEGKIYLVANNLSKGNVLGVFKHEVVHALLRQDAAFMQRRAELMTAFEKLMGKDASVDAAAAKVPANTPAQVKTEEALAYWVQNADNHKHSLFKRMVAVVKAALKRLGVPTTSMTTADFSLLFVRGTQDFVQQGAQSVAGSSGTLFSQEEVVTHAKAFYSKLQRVAAEKFAGMKAQSVEPFLLKQGVKKAEIEATGLREWLAGKKPTDKVSKGELSRFVEANTVEFEDVVLGEPPDPIEREALNAERVAIVRRQREMVKQGIDEGPEFDALTNRKYDIDDRQAEMDAAMRHTHFSNYTEPGAKEGSYREMFVTAPDDKSKLVMERQALAAIDRERPLTSQEQARYDELQKVTTYQDFWQDGHSQYSDITNPIIRIRFNEVEGPNGERILRIEEMQGPSPENQAKMPKHLKDSIYQIGVKRILAYAKENGFDGVALATKPGRSAGETQADRYSLEKQIEKIAWDDNRPSGNKHVLVDAKDGNGFQFSVNKDGRITSGPSSVNGRMIDEAVGKDAAEKIMDRGEGELTGLDLKVGGEGLKQLYDKDLPNIFKAWGGQIMEKIDKNIPIKTTEYFGPHYTIEQLKEAEKVTSKGGPDIMVSPLTGERQQFAVNRVAIDTPLRKIINRMESGEDFGTIINEEGSQGLATFFGGEFLRTGAEDTLSMPYIPITTRTAEEFPLFSQASTAHSAARSNITANLKEIASDRLTEFSPFFLRVAPLRTLVQTIGTKIKQIGAISNAFDEMNHVSTSMVEDAKGNYDEHQRLNKKATGNNDKFNLAATTATFYRMTPWKNMESQAWVPSNVTSREDKLKGAEVRWKAAGMDKATGKSFIAAYIEAAKAYNAIGSKEAQEQYQKMARHMGYIRQREETNVLATIEKATVGNATLRAAMMERFNATFKNISGTYWPLTREGEYILQYKDADGLQVVEHFLSAKERRLARQALEESGATEVQQGYASKTPRGQVAIPGELMQQFSQAIVAQKTAGLDPEQDAAAFTAAAQDAQDTINDLNQIWLRWQPETAALKNAIQRRNVKGYDLNAGRAYLEYVQRHAQSIAWTEQGRVIEDQLKGLQDQIKEERKAGKNVDLKQMVLNDLRERVQAARDTHVGPVASLLGKLGTAYYMTSPSIALVQMTQLPMLTLPKLGVMYGTSTREFKAIPNAALRSAKALMSAVQDSFSKKFSRDAMYGDKDVNELFNATRLVVTDEMRKTLGEADLPLGAKAYSDEEIAKSFAKLSPYQQKLFILRESLARNLLDISATHEAYAIAQGKNPDSAWRKAFDLAMTPMRLSEQASRKAAILATMELAQAQGKGFNRIMADVHEVVQDTLFSYDKTNKPVFLQGSLGRVFGMFQWYRIMSMFRMGLLFKRSIKAESKEVRTAAQKEFAGIVGMAGVLAGTMGMPLASAIFAAVNAASDDDEPIDAELEWRQLLQEKFGERLGDIAAYGLPAAVGMHLTKRIGLGDTFGVQSSPPPQMAGKDLAAWWAANQMGPAFSIGQSWVQAYDEMINKGNIMKGLEVAMPKPLKDAMKAYRVFDEGQLNSLSGKRVLGPEQITPDMVPLIALGFNPLEAAKANENIYSRTKLGAQLSRRRGRLIEDAAQALHGEGDIFEAKQALMDFNRKNPAFAIQGGEIRVAAVRAMKEGLGVPSKRERMLNSAYGIPPVE